MFGWFKRKASEKPLYPESLWTVELGDQGICGTDHEGTAKTVSYDGLRTVAIATNDSGPWGADVWWLLYGAKGELNCAFPQGATGEKQVLDYLFALPGFDNEEVIKAMGSTSEAVFLVWQKPDPQN